MKLVHKFEITSETPGFESLPEWWVSYDDSVITWRLFAPYLFEDDQAGGSFIIAARQWIEAEARGETSFIAAHPNVRLPATLSNPHTALYALNFVAPFEPSDELDEDDDDYEPYDEYEVKFSKRAPKLSEIFGPSHDKDGNQIIY